MTAASAIDDGWTLLPSVAEDIDELMGWFRSRDDVEIWGGPEFRYPFTRQTFLEDINWGRMRTFSLTDPAGEFVAFGQVYKRKGRIHLARLIAHPGRRRQGVGKRLIRMLMAEGRRVYRRDDYSLFVFRGNRAAYDCYRSLGFVVSDYPDDTPYADVCYFLTLTATT